MKTIEGKEKFLLDNGLLFEINRRVLHPIGYALDVEANSANTKKIYLTLVDSESEDGFYFDPETLKDGMLKFDRFMKREGEQRVESRKRILGYKEQGRYNE